MGIWLNDVTVKRRTVNLGSDKWFHGQKAFRSNGILPICVEQTGSSVVWLGNIWKMNQTRDKFSITFTMILFDRDTETETSNICSHYSLKQTKKPT
jgi:hypothetical protein